MRTEYHEVTIPGAMVEEIVVALADRPEFNAVIFKRTRIASDEDDLNECHDSVTWWLAHDPTGWAREG